MPGGITFDATQSYIAFSAIKLIGYSVAGLYLSRQYSNSESNFLIVGLFRTLLGVVFGVTVGIIGFWALDVALMVFLIGLIPIRFFEWWLTIRLFFDRNMENKRKLYNNSGIGIAWSFVLDIPAIFGFLATGGLWIC